MSKLTFHPQRVFNTQHELNSNGNQYIAYLGAIAAMSCSVAGSKVGGGRKYNIDDKFKNSPYLSKPLGSPKSIKSTRRKRGDGEDSVASFRTTRTQRTARTQQTSYRGSSHSQQSNKRNASTKNLLMPR